MTDHHAALIETMVLVSAVDADMTDAELAIIGGIVGQLPVFRDFDQARLRGTLETCAELFGQEDGLTRGLEAIKDGLPPKLYETAYALACDVVAADGEASQEELRALELLRARLGIDRLIAEAIERGTRARFTVR